MSSKPGFEVNEGRTTIVVPHQGKTITFVTPEFDCGFYADVGRQIDKAGLLRPTFAETISLAYSATQNRDNKYAERIVNILSNSSFWGFNPIRCDPKHGMFVMYSRGKEIQVPFGYKTGRQTLAELVKNPFVLTLAEGEEGADKLTKIIRFLKKKPRVSDFRAVNSIEKRAPSLGSNCEDFNLNLFGIDWDSYGASYSFGISR